MTGWQPIDDKAKDGTPLWLIGTGVYHGMAFAGAYEPSEIHPGSPWVNSITKQRLMEHVVTHYQRALPPPPEDIP